jgi:hypothetical protein
MYVYSLKSFSWVTLKLHVLHQFSSQVSLSMLFFGNYRVLFVILVLLVSSCKLGATIVKLIQIEGWTGQKHLQDRKDIS